MKMNLATRIALAGLTLSAAVLSSNVFAQEAVPDHPRVNEVNDRLANQQNRIQAGVADGQINAKQEARDEKRDANIAQRESADEAKHGGHLTKAEQNHLNRSLNHNSRAIHRQRSR